MIRAVISDFGGVLTTPLIESFRAYREESGLSFERLGDAMARVAERSGGEHPLFELERGRITEAEFLGSIESELGGDVRLSSLRETYFAHLHPNERMIVATACTVWTSGSGACSVISSTTRSGETPALKHDCMMESEKRSASAKSCG